MPAQTPKTRAKTRTAHKPAKSPRLTKMVAADVLRSWLIPALAGLTGFAVFVMHNIGLVDDASAVSIVGLLGLAVVLFYGLRSFTEHRLSGGLLGGLIAFAVLWSVSAGYPLYRAVHPGAPVFSTELHRTGPPVTVPLKGQPGRYSIMVEGRFVPTDQRSNRTATYSLAIGHDGETDRVIQGVFSQTWHNQRVGAGRRSSTVPVMSQTTQALNAVDDPDGRDLTLKLTELSPVAGDSVSVRVYAESIPRWLLIALGGLTVVAAAVVDVWRPKGANEGLMATLTVAVLVTVVTFRASATATPGFPQLAVAALMGTLAGAVGGSVLWRVTQPLRKRVAQRA